jgi:hypothetical protein
MADQKNLARFSIEAGEGGFQLQIEDDSGETLSLFATEEQIDVIVEALDDALEDNIGDDVDEADEAGAE